MQISGKGYRINVAYHHQMNDLVGRLNKMPVSRLRPRVAVNQPQGGHECLALRAHGKTWEVLLGALDVLLSSVELTLTPTSYLRLSDDIADRRKKIFFSFLHTLQLCWLQFLATFHENLNKQTNVANRSLKWFMPETLAMGLQIITCNSIFTLITTNSAYYGPQSRNNRFENPTAHHLQNRGPIQNNGWYTE